MRPNPRPDQKQQRQLMENTSDLNRFKSGVLRLSFGLWTGRPRIEIIPDANRVLIFDANRVLIFGANCFFNFF